MIKSLLKYYLIALICFQALPLKAEQGSLQNLTILVSSCDKYAEVWPPFFTFFFRYWPTLKTEHTHIPLVLLTNEKTFDDPRVAVFQAGPDKNWSDNLLEVLKAIPTDYVLYIQEDYFFTQPVDEVRLQEILNAMDKEGAGYAEVSPDPHFDYLKKDALHPSLQGVAIKERFTDDFRTSLQGGLWRKDVLIWLLKSGESPWEFEQKGSIRSQGVQEPFWAVVERHPLHFLNACHRGYWKIEALEYMKEAGIKLSNRQLPLKEENRILRFFQRNFPNMYNRLMKP